MRYLCLYNRHVTTVHKQFILAKQIRQKEIGVTNHQPCPSSMIYKLDRSKSQAQPCFFVQSVHHREHDAQFFQ